MARNFNDKIRRLIRKNPENYNVLPQFFNKETEQFESKITVAGLKDLIETRQDYNRLINMLKRFSRKGAETIIEIPGNVYESRTTKWQAVEMKRMATLVNRKRKERLEELSNVEMKSSEGLLGYTLGDRFGMGLASENRLKPIKVFTPAQSQTDIKQKQRALLAESTTKYFDKRDMILKNNYINTILQNFNESDVKSVLSTIRGMDANEFLLKFEAAGDKFEKIYPPSYGTPDYYNYVEELKAYWLNK